MNVCGTRGEGGGRINIKVIEFKNNTVAKCFENKTENKLSVNNKQSFVLIIILFVTGKEI